MRALKIAFTLVLLCSQVFAAGSTPLSSEIIKIMETAHERKVSQRVVVHLGKLLSKLMQPPNPGATADTIIQQMEATYSASEIRDVVDKIKSDEHLQEFLKLESQDIYHGKPVLLNNRVTYLLNSGQDKTFNVEYISALRSNLNLVGIHISTGGNTIALRQTGVDRFQFVEIVTAGFGRAHEMNSITEEFSTEELPEIAEKAKVLFKNATVDSIIPAGNISAWAFFGIQAGGVRPIQAIPAMTIAALFDIISAPLQLAIWGTAKIKSVQSHNDLAKRVALESNNIIRLSVSQYTEVRTALFQVLPINQMHGMCARFYL